MRRLLAFFALVVCGVVAAAPTTGPVTYTTTTITPGTTACKPDATPSNQIIVDSNGASYRCHPGTSKYVRADIPICSPTDPPTGNCLTGQPVCKSALSAALYGCDGAGTPQWAAMTGSGASPAGSNDDVQVKSGSSLGAVTGFTAASTGAVTTKILNGVRQLSGYKDLGDGLTAATCWTGFEDAFDTNPRKVHAPAGYYCWATPKTVSPVSINDREPRFELTGDGVGATVFIVSTVAALTIDGSATSGAYGLKIGDFSVGLGSDIGYSNGIFHLKQTVNYDISNIQFYGGDKFGSAGDQNDYGGYLLNLNTSYQGNVRRISSYGRYVYIFEKDDAALNSEDDTIHFDSLLTQGPLMGLVRFHNSGVHNLLFTNLKYQTLISLAADVNQYDVTTANGAQSAGITSYVVASSANFQAGDPVLLDVGDKLELNKVASVPDGTHLTLTYATRFAHATATQVLHGGVGIGLSGSSHMITFKSAMFEQCASGVMLDKVTFLHMEDVLTSCKEVVQVVGPISVANGSLTGLWHGTFKNIELSWNPTAADIYVVHVKTSGDSVDVRQLEFDHVERNSSSDDTVIALQNDSAVERNYTLWRSISGTRVFENHISALYSQSSDIESIWYGGTKVHNWTGAGNYTATGTVTAAGFAGDLTGGVTVGSGKTANMTAGTLVVPNAAAPTVDAFAEIAGDNNLWASGRGAPVFYDGTAATALVNVLVSDTPSNGQFPRWNTGGTITWETPPGGGDVVGPTTSTDTAVPRYGDTSGNLVDDSGVLIDDDDKLTAPGGIDTGDPGDTFRRLDVLGNTTELDVSVQPASGLTAWYALGTGGIEVPMFRNAAGIQTFITTGSVDLITTGMLNTTNPGSATNVLTKDAGGEFTWAAAPAGLTYTYCTTLYDRTALQNGDDLAHLFEAPAAITFTSVRCDTDAGTSTITLEKSDGTDMVTACSCTSTRSSCTRITAGNEHKFADGALLDFVMVSAGGTAKRLNVCLEYTYD